MIKSESGKPIIVQSDRTVLLEVDNSLYESARDALARFAELEKSPEYIHSYRITPLSLWNAAAAALTPNGVVDALQAYAKYPVPDNVQADIFDYMSRYGRLQLTAEGDRLCLSSQDQALIAQVARHKTLKPYVLAQTGPLRLQVDPLKRGAVKQALIAIGYPVEDLAGYAPGAPLHFSWRSPTRSGEAFVLRAYQRQAVGAFHAGGGAQGGSGVIVLPCGAGKTVVGIAAMEKLQCATLVLTTNTVATRQWISELLDKTSLPEDAVGEYSGLRKQVRPVTIATYQIMTYRPRVASASAGDQREFPHLTLFSRQDWGLIIYDEVHLLPAPVFRITAEIQSRRRLGLTATLVREDGRETDVFSLIGPKKFDAPWRELEHQGWIAVAECHEIRTSLPDELRIPYAVAPDGDKYRIAAENPQKLAVLQQVLSKHPNDSVLIIGMYLSQIEKVAAEYGFPVITGRTSVDDRQRLFSAFRSGEIKRLIVSKVGNFAIDLPDANVAIQISGTFGSRQEEAQRLGRILRPKQQGLLAHFYTIVTRDTCDQDYAAKRQLFLTEQGYHYDILYDDELATWQPKVRALQAYAARPGTLV